MAEETMEEKLARLEKENEELKKTKKKTKELSLKVSQKGGVSLYGMGRFPVTLYKEQWERLLGHKEAIVEFIEENKDQLTVK